MGLEFGSFFIDGVGDGRVFYFIFGVDDLWYC